LKSRREFLRSVAGAAGAAAFANLAELPSLADTGSRPNLVCILGEGLRWDESSIAGNPILHTPNIDRIGRQIAVNTDSDIDELPVHAALDAQGQEIRVTVTVGERPVQVKVWWARVGNIRIYLLDTDLPDNHPEDREITHRLYGGGSPGTY
jgi:hypothetical protein